MKMKLFSDGKKLRNEANIHLKGLTSIHKADIINFVTLAK